MTKKTIKVKSETESIKEEAIESALENFKSKYSNSSATPHLNALNDYQQLAKEWSDKPNRGTPLGLLTAVLALGVAAGTIQRQINGALVNDTLIEVGNLEPTPAGSIVIGEVSFDVLTEKRRRNIIRTLGYVLSSVSSIADEIGMNLSDIASTNLEELADDIML